MMTRYGVSLAVLCAGLLVVPAPAAAQQTINFSLGYFTIRGEDARIDGDVLLENRDIFDFEIGDFNGAVFGAEWLVPVGRYLEGGAGIGFSRRTVRSAYLDYEDTGGFDIEQDLRLRLIPLAFTFRALPLGQDSPVQPYVGAGLGLFNWRYTEVGDFIDFSQPPPFPVESDRFTGSGTTAGPIVLGGLRFAADSFVVGGEVRYQRASDDLPAGEFYGTRIDLSGWSYLFTAGVRFGGR